jgi:hypothetical protein
VPPAGGAELPAGAGAALFDGPGGALAGGADTAAPVQGIQVGTPTQLVLGEAAAGALPADEP